MEKEFIKVTKNLEVMRRLTMFEVIEKAQNILKEKNIEGPYGKYVVLFLDKNCGQITYVINNLMPMPYTVKDIEEEEFKDVVNKTKKILREQGLTIIQSKTGVFEKVDEDLRKKVLEEIKYRKSLN